MGLQTRISRLEDSISCPKCKTALACPQCSQHEQDELTDQQRFEKVQALFEWARARQAADAMFDEPTEEPPHGQRESRA